jgi:DNA-binding MarR family transcriptional regulator
METAAGLTRALRREMRRNRPTELSMQQFRALGIVSHHPGSSVSVVAGHIGLTMASASKLVDALVKLGLVTREASAEDRRRVVLHVTESGYSALATARSAALGRLASFLGKLTEAERSTVLRCMDILQDATTELSAWEDC